MVSQVEVQLQESNQQLRQRVAELEVELQQTRLRLEELDQIYSTAPIGLCLMDCELRFVMINARLAEINGLPIKDHIGASLREVLPDLAEKLEPLYRQVIETGEPILELDVQGTTRVDREDPGSYLVSYFPVRDSGGEVTGVNTVVQDVSDIKRAEQKLYGQSDLLQHIISNVPHSIFWKDRKSVYMGCNERTAADLHLDSPGDIVGMTDFDTSVTRKQAEGYRHLDNDVMQRDEPILNVEERQRRVDGEEAVLLTSKVPLHDADGNVTGVLGIYTDITERKHEEQRLQESEERLRTTMEHSPEAIVVMDVDRGTFVDANGNAEQLFGLEREELLATNPIEMSPPSQPDGTDSAQLATMLLDNTLAGKAQAFDWVHLNANGQEVPCEIRLVRLPYAGRNLVRGSITDISDRIEAQRALQQANDELERRVAERTTELTDSEERWRSLIETAPDIILTVNPDGTIRFINRVEPGYTPEDVIGTSAYEHVREEERAAMKACYKHVLKTGEIQSIDLTVDRPDGSTKYYSARLGPFVENGTVAGITSIATDVTQRKIAEEKLIAEDQLLRQLLDLQETERRMVAYDIHDGFLQDVVGAQMHIEGLRELDDLDAFKTSLAEVARILRRGISEGRRLIRDLRPMVLDEEGVVEAIRHLVADEKKHQGLDVGAIAVE